MNHTASTILLCLHDQKPKSEIAAKAVREMNPQMNITAHQNRLDANTEEVYDYHFFTGLDGVAAALDNTEGSQDTSSTLTSLFHKNDVIVAQFFFPLSVWPRGLPGWTLRPTLQTHVGRRHRGKQGSHSGGGSSHDRIVWAGHQKSN